MAKKKSFFEDGDGLKLIVFIAIIVITSLILSKSDFFSSQIDFSRSIVVVPCDSGLCSDFETRGLTTNSLSRAGFVGGAVCSEQRDAEAYIETNRDFNSITFFNNQATSQQISYNQQIGAHSGIIYHLFPYKNGSFSYNPEEVAQLSYRETAVFQLEENVRYRVDVYYCDLNPAFSSCEDSDEGINLQVKGLLRGNQGVYEDTCLSEDSLLERYCDQGPSAESKVFSCREELGSSYECEAGACVKKSFLQRTTTKIFLGVGGVFLIFLIIFTGVLSTKKRK